MKLNEIFVPYNKVQRIQFQQRLLLETEDFGERFKFIKIDEQIQGVYNKIVFKDNINIQGIINHKIRIYNTVPLPTHNHIKVFYSDKINNIQVFQFEAGLFILDIDFYSNISLRDRVLKDNEYLNYIADRFEAFLNGNDFNVRKKKFKEKV